MGVREPQAPSFPAALSQWSLRPWCFLLLTCTCQEGLGPPLLLGRSSPWVLFAACPLRSHSSSLFSLCHLSLWVTPQQACPGRKDHWVEAPLGAQVEALQGTSCVSSVPSAQDRAGRRAGAPGSAGRERRAAAAG